MSGVQIKICGLTNRDDAAAAMDFRVDYLGFVLYPKSPRGITAAKLVEIVDSLPSGFRAIGVFVNTPCEEIEVIAGDAALYAVQLHGDEAPADYMGIRIPIWRAVQLREGRWQPDPAPWSAARYVVDATVKGKYGGTGVTADWAQAAVLARQHPVVLAGGLNPDNVSAAIKAVSPLVVDVVSGIESAPGRKDLKKLRAFVDAVHRRGESSSSS